VSDDRPDSEKIDKVNKALQVALESTRRITEEAEFKSGELTPEEESLVKQHGLTGFNYIPQKTMQRGAEALKAGQDRLRQRAEIMSRHSTDPERIQLEREERAKRKQFNGLGIAIMKVVVAAVLLWALAAHPSGYYTLLRWITCAAAVFTVMRAAECEKVIWFYVFIIVAVLFNPIIPIYLKRETWAVLDVVAAGLFLLSIVDGRNREELVSADQQTRRGTPSTAVFHKHVYIPNASLPPDAIELASSEEPKQGDYYNEPPETRPLNVPPDYVLTRVFQGGRFLGWAFFASTIVAGLHTKARTSGLRESPHAAE